MDQKEGSYINSVIDRRAFIHTTDDPAPLLDWVSSYPYTCRDGAGRSLITIRVIIEGD